MRSIEEIQNQLRIALKDNNSPLTDFNPQGINYTLFRSIASAMQQAEVSYYDEILDSADFTKLSGDSLDQFASFFGLSRQAAAQAYGWLLVTGAAVNTEIVSGSTFTSIETGNQYISTNSSSIAISPYIESVVPIRAALYGKDKALSAGKQLSSDNKNILEAVVGFERKFDGSPCGNMQDGGDLESDSSLRNRMFSVLRAGGIITKDSLRSLIIEHPSVLDASVTTKSPGVVEILIKSNSSNRSSIVEDISTLINPYLISSVAKVQIKDTQPLRIDLSLQVDSTTDLNSIKNTIRTICENSILLAQQTKVFDPEDLVLLISPYVKSCVVLEPQEILTWDSKPFLELGDLNVNIKI